MTFRFNLRIDMFRIVNIKGRHRLNVIERLRSDLLHHLFVIYHLLPEPEKTSMYVAYDKDNSPRAHLVVYRGSATPMARLDGEKKPARKLLEVVPSENMVLFCPPRLVNVVKNKFPRAHCYPEHQMHVAKGQERLITPNLAQRLGSGDASLLAELYSSGGQRFLSRRSEGRCRAFLEKYHVYGIFEDDRLVSVAAAVKRLPEVGEITGVLTHPDYRRRSFGATTTSAATEDVLLHAGGANLYVGADNTPAIKMYEKLGYRKINDWYWVDIGTGSKP